MLVNRLIVAPLSILVSEIFQSLVHEGNFGGLGEVCFHGGVVDHYGVVLLLDELCA